MYYTRVCSTWCVVAMRVCNVNMPCAYTHVIAALTLEITITLSLISLLQVVLNCVFYCTKYKITIY